MKRPCCVVARLFKADTLEELADQMGVPADDFVAEMDRFNEFVKAGEDEDFGRYLFTEISAVDTPPFYAAPATWAAHITIGGINTDEDFCVVTEDGARIEGLYAAGEARNGICGVRLHCRRRDRWQGNVRLSCISLTCSAARLSLSRAAEGVKHTPPAKSGEPYSARRFFVHASCFLA